MRLEPSLTDRGLGEVRTRNLVNVDGRNASSDDLTTCLDPLEPVGFPRADRQREFAFTAVGIAGRRAHVVQFRGR